MNQDINIVVRRRPPPQKKRGGYSKHLGCDSKHALWGLKPGSGDGFRSIDMAIRRGLTVGVQKRRPVVETLWHQSVGPNVLCEAL